MLEGQPTPHQFDREAVARKTLEAPEFADLNKWYQERLASFPEMTTRDASLTDGKSWKSELTPEGEVDNVDGAFFTLKGQQVIITMPDGTTRGWTQPGTIQKEGQVIIETPEGAEEITTSGLIGAIKDAQGNYLITLGQEPFAKGAQKRVLARTPIQTSAAKLAAVLSGDTGKDQAMYDFMSTVTGSSDISGFFAHNAQEIFPIPYADANRIEATNIGFTTKITDETMHEAVTNGGANRWCSPREVSTLAKAGILNGHTAAVVQATQFD